MGPACQLILPFDVTDKQGYKLAAEEIRKTAKGLDMVIFNAGISEFFDIKEFDSSVFERVLKTNFLGMVYGIEAALPLLRLSSTPYLVGMCSLASYGGLPSGHAAYTASKAAIRNMLQGIRIDLLPEKIPVSVICPGFVKTKLSDQNKFYMPARLTTQKSADIIVSGLVKMKEEIHFPKRVSLPSKLLGSLPSAWQTWITAKLFHII